MYRDRYHLQHKNTKKMKINKQSLASSPNNSKSTAQKQRSEVLLEGIYASQDLSGQSDQWVYLLCPVKELILHTGKEGNNLCLRHPSNV